ncbi:Uma2 family endonuclease [Nocardioides sp. LMS-CY]|nr:Uma2 family endonuclease [Nocardioides sp. LMS-CY]
MVVMTTLPRGRALTVADIEAMPDDGQRYELIDGVLVVSPTPAWRHQDVLTNLLVLLRTTAPAHLRVLPAPTAVIIDERTWVEPDIVVAPKSDYGAKYLDHPPLLAVEVLSPSNRIYDLNTKFARYERAGIASYWVVDPDELRLVVWELVDGRYVEIADVGPGERWSAVRPFPVAVAPGDLTD